MYNYVYYSRRLYLSARFLLLAVLMLNTTIANAQEIPGQNSYKLTLAEAVQFAKSQNKWVQAAGIEESAAGEDRKDAYNATHCPQLMSTVPISVSLT
jgi:outer membrane protein